MFGVAFLSEHHTFASIQLLEKCIFLESLKVTQDKHLRLLVDTFKLDVVGMVPFLIAQFFPDTVSVPSGPFSIVCCSTRGPVFCIAQRSANSMSSD